MANYKDVDKFEYPSKVTLTGAIKGLWQTSKISTLFHVLMTLMSISGLVIDLLGMFLGGSLATIRLFHGYLGVLFVVIFPLYLIMILAKKKMRMLMSPINYVNFALYGLLLFTGIGIAAANQPWVDVAPWLQPHTPLAPPLHTITTYVWLLVSILFPGGFLHGIATVYLVSIQGKET